MKPKHENGEYLRLKELGDLNKDNNNCSVIAIAAGLGITYEKAKDALETAGRVTGKGATEWVIRAALTSLGQTRSWIRGRRYVESYKYSNTLTFNNAVRVLDKEKKYLLIGVGHMVCLKYGQVVDWAEGRKMRVDNVIEVQ